MLEKKIKEEQKRRRTEENESEIKMKEKEKKIKEEIKKERQKIVEEKNKLEEERKKLKEMKKERLEEIERQKNLRYNNGANETISNQGRNNSNLISDQFSNYMNSRNNKEVPENYSSRLNKKTLGDSEILDQELLSINDTNNIELINEGKKNNYMALKLDENNINNYQKIYDKEVSNKIKYELQKDLINKQKKSYNMTIMKELKNKSEGVNKKDNKNNNLIQLKTENNRNKLILLDLENNEIKEIEKLLKDGIDEDKLKKLELKYKDNEEIIEILNNYKIQKLILEKSKGNEEINISDSMKKDNIYLKNVNMNYMNENNINETNNRYQNNISLGDQYNSLSSIKDLTNLAPFYYLSNGNKLSRNTSSYNNKNININIIGINSNDNSQEQIIQNKLKEYKEKLYKPFLNKIEKEKINELKRIQLLNSVKDPNVRSSLETKFGIQRGKIDYELSKEQEKINRDIQNYENQLLLAENKNQIALEKNIFFD